MIKTVIAIENVSFDHVICFEASDNYKNLFMTIKMTLKYHKEC